MHGPSFVRAVGVGALCLGMTACGDDGGGSASQTGTMSAPTSVTVTDGSATTPTTTAGSDSATGTSTVEGTMGGSATVATTEATGTTGMTGMTEPVDVTTGGMKFDVGGDSTTGGAVDKCKATDSMDAPGDCTITAPPDAFEPDIQWSWDGPGAEKESLVTPLVANLTDDNGDGEIDLCDTPDILVTVTAFPSDGHIYVLDGKTGALHFQIPTAVTWSINPAIGDIDGDLLPEIVAAVGPGFGGPSSVVVFEHDGALKWQNDFGWQHGQGGAISLADLDNDGDVEIMLGSVVVDHTGQTVFNAEGVQAVDNATVVAADLDGDGDLEVVHGPTAFHHDGAPYYSAAVNVGFPQVANLDADPQPEVLINSYSGLTVLEHDGAIKFKDLTPTGDGAGSWFRPSTVHDFDGDDISEFAASSASHYSVFEADGAVLWTANVQDGSGWAAGTAFDFDGNGIAEAMYGDETNLFVFDGKGVPLLSVPRSARTLAEYPVVADVDNDGSAEIVIVSDAGFANNQTAPTVQVIRDVEDRWIQARRIWNQHTYHVTNVREDGGIPQFEAPWWQSYNTFRTNSQIEAGEECIPPQ